MCNLALKIKNNFTEGMEKHDFVTIANISKEKILYMIKMAQEFEKHPNREILKGKVVDQHVVLRAFHTHTTEF